MKLQLRFSVLVAVGFMALPLASMAGPAQDVITTPPKSINSSAQDNADSTLQVREWADRAETSQIHVRYKFKATCEAKTETIKSTGYCPAGQTYNGVGGGTTAFTRSYQRVTTCPQGIYKSPSVHQTPVTPSAAQVCATPPPSCKTSSDVQSQPASCPANFLTVTGSATFTQTRTVTVSCPSGPYGSSHKSTGAWAPASNTSTCPKRTRNTDPDICMANGGLAFSVTPVRIATGGFSKPNSSTIGGRSTGRWNAVGSYTATIAFNGSSATVTDTCTRDNSTGGISTTDWCEHGTQVNVGGGTFVVGGSYDSPTHMDFPSGVSAPYSGSGSVRQINCGN